MVIEIRGGSEVPIYLQLRNQIVSGISAGALLIETPEAYTEGELVRLQ